MRIGVMTVGDVDGLGNLRVKFGELGKWVVWVIWQSGGEVCEMG